MKVLNRRAKFDYQLFEKFEAGIVLTGAEVKSVKMGRLSLEEAFVRVKDGEAYLFNATIPAYPYSSPRDYQPQRTRKLLLHRQEITSLGSKMKQKNLTLVPVSCYTKRGKIKLEIALGKGKKKFEKKKTIKKRDIERQLKGELP